MGIRAKHVQPTVHRSAALLRAALCGFEADRERSGLLTLAEDIVYDDDDGPWHAGIKSWRNWHESYFSLSLLP